MNVDVHCHLLPGVDDGCKTLEESLEIAEAMKSNGAEKLIFTPHLYSPRVPTNIDRIKETYLRTRESFLKMGIKIELGAELFLWENLSSKTLMTLGDSQYLLIELPDFEPPYLFKEILNLQQKGYYVILAHVERYSYLFDGGKMFSRFFRRKAVPDRLLRLKDMGVLFQINWNSIRDKNKRARYMFENGLIDFIGSDKHRKNDGRDVVDFSSELMAGFTNSDFGFGGARDGQHS
ncbi:tyrosine-protein phosphatase [Kosmotoga pacifica]|uniref:tyrosine-protein phosphatase n=1 Tax=Kosmotoga pacifica TaxID=1330330 RepID=UPI00069A6717|nr:CpsB/CapC family capsule biosynthesis tyrosine phosphatase [Kosmotoga pacifica]